MGKGGGGAGAEAPFPALVPAAGAARGARRPLAGGRWRRARGGAGGEGGVTAGAP